MVTKSMLFSQLKDMKAPQDRVVLMHSSLRSIGEVEGGVKGLLDALIEYFTARGGLFCVPTHTWHLLEEEVTLEMTSPENCLGYFATAAIEDGRGLRTESPTHSMVIFGDRAKAERLAAGERTATTPTSPETVYGKLFEEDGYVLLVGVSQNRNTYLHAVDEMLKTPNRMGRSPLSVAIRYEDGTVKRRSIFLYETDYSDDISHRFFKYETPFRYARCLTDGFLGNAPTQLCSARKMKETVEAIYQNSPCDPLETEKPIPPKYYVT